MTHVERIGLIVKLNLNLHFQSHVLCDYSDAYVLLSKTLAVVGGGLDDTARTADRTNK